MLAVARTPIGHAGHVDLAAVEDPRTLAHVIHEALHRPVLFAGTTPELVLMEATTVIALILLVGLHLVTLALAALYATVVHATAVWVIAHDPQMPAVYLRSLASQDYYAPHASPFAVAPPVRPSIPSRP
jgi:type IV secretory pathway TrbD component